LRQSSALSVRLFDITQANRLVPVLSQVFERVRGRMQRAQQLTASLDDVGDENPIGASIEDPASVIGRMRRERDELVREIKTELASIEEMGVEVKSLEGLVDFRAQREGRTVYLCWQFGESAVGHWHELDTGFSGRRPIDDAAVFQAAYLS
jgi:hypothetical protein